MKEAQALGVKTKFKISFAETDEKYIDIRQILSELKDLIPMTKAEWIRVQQELEQKAFFAAGLTKKQIEEDLLRILTDTVEQGKGVDDFIKQVEESMMEYTSGKLKGEKVAPWHAETIFRTNIAGAVQLGKNKLYEHPVMKEVFPAFEWVTVDDGRSRDTHVQLNGRVWKADNPIWVKIGGKTMGPPIDYNCRCDKIGVYVDDWDGVESSTDLPNGLKIFGREIS